MRETVLIGRLDALEGAHRENTLILGRQITRLFARQAALEEMFFVGPENAPWWTGLLARCLIFKNSMLTLLAPGYVSRLITRRENAIVNELKQQAEDAFLAKELERNRERTPAADNTPERAGGPKKP